MANSKVTIQFNDPQNVGNYLNLRENKLGINLNEIFTTFRYGSGQVTTPELLPDDPDYPDGKYSGYASENYKTAFDLDYNTTGLFTVTNTNGSLYGGIGIVVIEANYAGAEFEIIYDGLFGSIVEVENEPAFPDFTIDSVTFTPEPSDYSNRCKINVATNHLATKLLQPFVINPNTNNPIVFSSYRAMTFNVEVEDANGLRVLQSVTTPDYLNINNFTLTINNSPNGATMVASAVNVNGLDLQYSLDATTWQISNVFTGLTPGIYMFWVKDQLGAMVNVNFTVDEFGIYTPYFYISKSNSIRYANRIIWGDSENYKNDENTLSFEAFAKDSCLAYKEIQMFQSADIITTQFKSNYETNTAVIIKSDGTEISVPVVKMTNNIGIKDKRDAMMYDVGNGKTGVYFMSGNTYDYNTGVVNGSYVLNGLLPEWASVGNYIQIGTAWFFIEEIAYDEDRSADVIVFTNNYSGADTSIIAGTIFNRFNYEVYEFVIDMVDYIDQYFKVRINNTDPKFTEIIHLSELIWCKVKHEKVLEIKYRNSTNTDMFYATGITNLIRQPITYIKGKVNEENETHKTDTTAILLSSELYECDDFVFEPVTKEIWRKLMQALSHETVTLNGVGYVKNGDFNTEGPLEDSNLYVLTATMIKTGSVYNSQTSGGNDFTGSEVEVPGLIQTDSGYVSYI